MRATPTAELINQLVLVGRLQALHIQHGDRELLLHSSAILSRVVATLVNELAAEQQAAIALKKAAS